MKFRSAALTDIGKVRPENEDRLLCEDKLGLYGIADGIGGLPGGAEAAACTVDFIKAGIKSGVTDLNALTQASSEAVVKLGQQINPPYGIGSTLTFGLLKGNELQIAHVGDSRAYLLRAGHLQPLTEDHNIENEARHLRERGEFIEVSAANSQALTRCIGQPGLPQVDLKDITVLSGDLYFFVTDGITRMITDSELTSLLATEAAPKKIVQTIIDLALERGGYDNVTAVLLIAD